MTSSGVVKITFNGKSKNTSLFTFNLATETQEELNAKLRDKVVEYFKWYSTFQNRDPIQKFEAYSSDFVCKNKCGLNAAQNQHSIVGVIFEPEHIQPILEEEAKKYGLVIDIEKYNVNTEMYKQDLK